VPTASMLPVVFHGGDTEKYLGEVNGLMRLLRPRGQATQRVRRARVNGT